MKIGHQRRISSLALMLGVLLSLITPLISGPLPVTYAANPASVTIAGSLDSKIGCTGDWQPDCAAAHLTYDASDDVWQGTFNLPAGNFEYKAALNDNWNESYGLNTGSGNIPLNLAAPTTVKFYYDNKTHWVTSNVNSVIAVAPGSFQSKLGCPGDWDPGCLRSWLQDTDGDGIYTFETTALPAGSYEGKVAINESWNENYGQGGAPGGANYAFSVATNNAKVTFKYNATTHVLSILSGHGLDNNVEYDGLGHDSRDSLYRTPFGAVNPGTEVLLRFRTYHKDVSGVTLRLYDTAFSQEQKIPMQLVANGVDCYDANLTGNGSTCDFWQASYTPSKLGTVYYRFIVKDGTATAYYADTANRYDGVGRATNTEEDTGFRLNVVDPKFKVIPWMQNGVMYQIFPDRFRNGEEDNDPKVTEPRYNYPAPVNATSEQKQAAANDQIQLRNWNDLPEGVCAKYDSNPTTCTEAPRGRDYFGGDLQGVIDKLDYLRSLGITIIYFNPIFESGSNHGYDTRDYTTISHFFGTNQTFKKLVKEGEDKGIKIVLDGVFNHLSSDSPFFDRYHHYTTVGACESTTSIYRSWFNFKDVTPGTGVCVDSQNRPNAATYNGWAGFDSIPEIVKKDPTDPNKPYGPVADYFYKNKNTSVSNLWLKMGAAGWRFDVMTDPSFPASFWQELRTITKGITPDEILIAEAWHWYDNLPLTHGDQADTAMGYRFRNAVFGLLGAVDDKGFDEENNPNLPPSTFANRMNSLREDYADATYYTFQNLLDSHDTKRLLWSLTPGGNNRQDKEFNATNLAKGKARQQIAALVQMTVPGTPTIYYGDEVGVTGADDPDDRRTFPWTDLNDDNNQNKVKDNYYGAGGDHNLLDFYRNLTSIRAKNSVLRQGKLSFLLTDDTNLTLSYAMRTNKDLAIIVINRNETQAKTINVPTAGYLRNGVTLVDQLGKSSVTTSGGKLTTTLNPLQGAIFVMSGRQDIVGPVPSTDLSAISTNGLTSTVALKWTGNDDSVSYNIYRSPVKGGGYLKIANSTTTSYTDSTVKNGTTYYYVVRGVDSLGNEGANSGEANATPSFPIGYAVIQYPKTIDTVITSNYTTVYGQVYIAGLTDAGGETDSILASVGYGLQGGNVARWTWVPMSFNTKSGNNYEYSAGIRAEAPGVYNYLVRFSDDGGRTWTYGDQDGAYPGNPPTNLPGVYTVTASSDVTPPTAPSNLTIDWSASSLSLKWNASTDNAAVAEYRIYRGTAPGGEGATPIAIVPAGTTSYLDTTVGTGQTYYYVVKAYDTSLNASGASNEVFHKVEAKIVKVTFKVKVPASTPATDKVYITGQSPISPDPLCGYCGGGTAATEMTQVAPNIWQITLNLPDGAAIQYKYTRGTYDYVEEWGTIAGFTNRVATVHPNSISDLTQLFDDTSDSNPDDNHKAVQNWRDPVVASTTAGASGVTVAFNWDVKPSGADFSTSVVVKNGTTTVAGIVSHNAATNSLTFTPTTALAPGTYTVTVDNVISLTQNNDGVKIRTPYVFTFTV